METDETLKTTDGSSVADQTENPVSSTGSMLRKPLEPVYDLNCAESHAIDKPKMIETECNLSSDASTSMQDASKSGLMYVDSEEFKVKSVKIYAEDTGPKFYPVKGNVVTPPIISKNLPEAFSYLPIYGRPKCGENLEEFQNNKIMEYVGCNLNEVEFDKLAKYCSPEHLKTGKEISMSTKVPTFGILPFKKEKEAGKNTTDGDHLKIVKKFKLRVEKDRANLYVKKLKYRGIRILHQSLEDSDDHKVPIGTPLEPGKDMLFIVRFYRPFFYGKERNNSRHSVFRNDLIVPGDCLLGALRERIVCANDVDLRLDVSNDPSNAPTNTAKQLFPSGFMFINNVFYVDRREGTQDYSAPIREWAKKRGYGDFPVEDMNSVRVDELVIKLGHPELYVHQGNCEHLFTFSQVRLLGARDPLYASQYPRHSCVSQHQTIYCTTCAEFGAKWLATGCSRVPFDPAFFCDICFKMYLYNGKRKVSNFRAYSFRGNEINLLKPLG